MMKYGSSPKIKAAARKTSLIWVELCEYDVRFNKSIWVEDMLFCAYLVKLQYFIRHRL